MASQEAGNLEKWQRIPGKSYLLAIGIDEYQHCGKLVNAVSDAKAFSELMVSKYQFESEQLITLFNEQATKEGITAAFRSLSDLLRSDVDNLLVYFSGHGFHDGFLNEGYWVPFDAKYSAEVDYISYSYITKVIKALPTRHTFFIVDSCYSGAMMVQERKLNAERFERDPSRWMLASGRNEVVPDGEIGSKSPFAEQLIDVLERNSENELRVSDLVNQVTTAVSYNSPQTPIGRPIFGVGDKGGEFIFRPKKSIISGSLGGGTTSSPSMAYVNTDSKNKQVQASRKSPNNKRFYIGALILAILSMVVWKSGWFGPNEISKNTDLKKSLFEQSKDHFHNGVLDSAAMYAYQSLQEQENIEALNYYLSCLRSLDMRDSFAIFLEQSKSHLDLTEQEDLYAHAIIFEKWPGSTIDSVTSYMEALKLFSKPIFYFLLIPTLSLLEQDSTLINDGDSLARAAKVSNTLQKQKYTIPYFTYYYYAQENNDAIKIYEEIPESFLIDGGVLDSTGLPTEYTYMYLFCLGTNDKRAFGLNKKIPEDIDGLIAAQRTASLDYETGRRYGIISMYDAVLHGMDEFRLKQKMETYLETYIADWWRVEVDPAFNEFRQTDSYDYVLGKFRAEIRNMRSDFVNFLESENRPIYPLNRAE